MRESNRFSYTYALQLPEISFHLVQYIVSNLKSPYYMSVKSEGLLWHGKKMYLVSTRRIQSHSWALGRSHRQLVARSETRLSVR